MISNSQRGPMVATLSALATIAVFVIGPLRALADVAPVYLADIPGIAGVQGHVQPGVQLFGTSYEKSLESLDANNDWTEIDTPNPTRFIWRWNAVYNLRGRYTRLSGLAGIVDNSHTNRVDSFEIDGDGRKLFVATPMMHAGDRPAAYDVDVRGVFRLALVVTSGIHDAEGGKDCAVWADPKLYPVPDVSDSPIDAAPVVSETASDQSSVFNWSDVPQNEDVVLASASFDEGGYQLLDTQGETIVVPFTGADGVRNLYVMKFGQSADDQFHFINAGYAPILYVPSGGFIENATVPGGRWYPFASGFSTSEPAYMGMAPDWDGYTEMGWYPDMFVYGGYYSYQPYGPGVVFVSVRGTAVLVRGRRYHGWDDYRHYWMNHRAPYRIRYHHREDYDYVLRPHENGAQFDGRKRYGVWTGPHRPGAFHLAAGVDSGKRGFNGPGTSVSKIGSKRATGQLTGMPVSHRNDPAIRGSNWIGTPVSIVGRRRTSGQVPEMPILHPHDPGVSGQDERHTVDRPGQSRAQRKQLPDHDIPQGVAASEPSASRAVRAADSKPSQVERPEQRERRDPDVRSFSAQRNSDASKQEMPAAESRQTPSAPASNGPVTQKEQAPVARETETQPRQSEPQSRPAQSQPVAATSEPRKSSPPDNEASKDKTDDKKK